MAHQPLSEFDLEAAWKSAESKPEPKRPPKVPTPAPTPLVRDALRRQYAGIAFSIAITALYLYVLAVTNLKWLGAITPLGGLCLLGGWLALSFVRR